MAINTKLSPTSCGEILGVSADYIIGEINDGRLPAHHRLYESGRKRYRIDPIDFSDYITKYWPRKDRRGGQPRTRSRTQEGSNGD